jgi:opacity protein-like surface antigen
MIAKKKSVHLACLTVLSCFISSQAISGDMGAVGISEQTPAYRALITLTAGPDFVQKGQAQTLTLLPPYQNHYTTTNSTQSVFDGGVFVGIEKTLNERFGLQLGVSGYWDSNITPSGDVWQFALPEFDNLSYNYRIEHARVMASSKLLTSLKQYPAIHPYLSGELGVAFNKASNYQETPLIENLPPMAPFANQTQNSFSYGVGLGVDYSVTQHVRLGVGYQFADLGKASLGASPDAATAQSLSTSHLYTNQLRFQLTALL